MLQKPAGTGGLITPAVLYEQLLYEIGDPRAYLLPDVVCDFTQVRAEQVGPDQVRVQGARGRPPPRQLKVSATYPGGFKTSAGFLLAGEEAVQKGEAVGLSLLRKTEQLLRARGYAGFRDSRVDVLGAEATYGTHTRARASREVVVRIAASHESADALKLMVRELPQAGTGMAPGFASGIGGRAGAAAVIRLFSFLVDRDAVHGLVELDGCRVEVPDTHAVFFDPKSLREQKLAYAKVDAEQQVPLFKLAHGRSGDKGDHANIGILARRPEYVDLIGAALTEEAVAAHMAHVLDPDRGRVRRWALPGCSGWNFLLEHSLGGGGVASLRPDPQGKTFAQQLLAFEVPVPTEIHAALETEEAL